MKNKTQIITECGIAIALAALLSFLTVVKMPQGGAVSLVMLPLFITAYRRGVVYGILTGAVYGLVSLLIDGVIYHPLSVLLDYVLAFGLVGIAGFFKPDTKGIIFGTFLGVLCRFTSSFLSGWLLFASYAPEGQNVILYSLGYQAAYLVPELIICLVVLLILLKKAPRVFYKNKL